MSKMSATMSKMACQNVKSCDNLSQVARKRKPSSHKQKSTRLVGYASPLWKLAAGTEDPAARSAVYWAHKYARARLEELTAAHGTLGAAVVALIESAAHMHADARLWRARSCAADNYKESRSCLSASALALREARQTERDAMELAAKDAARKPAETPNEALFEAINTEGVPDESDEAPED